MRTTKNEQKAAPVGGGRRGGERKRSEAKPKARPEKAAGPGGSSALDINELIRWFELDGARSRYT